MTWTPLLAPDELEKKMEEQNLPEEDRIELRQFSEFLQRKKDKRDGVPLPPLKKEMKDWLLGNDTTNNV